MKNMDDERIQIELETMINNMIENFLSMTYKIDADDRIHELPYGCEPKAV